MYNVVFPLRLGRTSLTLACTAVLLHLSAAHATNGTMPHGYGIKAMGMGGASIALPQDAVAAANNPAGMAFVGHRTDLGLSVVMPRPEATIGGTGFDGSGVKAIAVPDFGYSRPLDARQSLGVSVYGNGVATQYDTSIAGAPGSGKDSAQLTQVIASPTYAVQLAPGHALGVSLDLVYQRFEVDGVPDAPGRESPGAASSFGAGFKLGWTSRLNEHWTVGAMYSARVHMGKLDRYKALLAREGQFDVPERYGIGVAWKPVPQVVVAADVMRVNWGDLDSLANALTDAEPGFGWQSQTIRRIGVAWDVSPAWTLRAGYSQGTRIISRDNTFLNYLAPVTPTTHVTLGGTYRLSDRDELSFAAARAFGASVDGAGPSTGVNVRMSQNWLGAAWSRSW